MNPNLFGMIGAFVVVAIVGFAVYRWKQHTRVRLINEWIAKYVDSHYGPCANFHINCSDDLNWPVLVSFDVPKTGIQHRLQFSCGSAATKYALLSSKEEQRIAM